MKYELSGGLYYIFTYLKRSFIIYWGILLLLVTVITTSINLFTEETMQVELTITTYIFSSVLGFVIVKSVFPYLIKMGITRKVIFFATGISFFILALANTIILQVVYFIINLIDNVSGSMVVVEYNGIKTNYQHLAQFINDTMLTRGVIDLSIMLFVLFIMFALGLIFYNHGLVAGISVLIILFIGLMSSIASGKILSFGEYIMNNFDVFLFYKMFAVSIVIYLLSYLGMFRMIIKQ